MFEDDARRHPQLDSARSGRATPALSLPAELLGTVKDGEELVGMNTKSDDVFGAIGRHEDLVGLVVDGGHDGLRDDDALTEAATNANALDSSWASRSSIGVSVAVGWTMVNSIAL